VGENLNRPAAESLVASLASCVGLIRDLSAKVHAFELVLESENPTLYAKYQKRLVDVQQNPPVNVSIAGLTQLGEALLNG
jgi:hypothetical protein